MSKAIVKAASEERMRRILATQVAVLMLDLSGTQKQLGERIGLDPAEISALQHGKIWRFSTERLIRSLRRMGHDVELSITGPKRSRKTGTIVVRSSENSVTLLQSRTNLAFHDERCIGAKRVSEIIVQAKDEDGMRRILATQLALVLFAKKGTQSELGKQIDFDQTQVSALKRGLFFQFSTDRLIRSLRRLGYSIELSIKRSNRRPSTGGIAVRVD